MSAFTPLLLAGLLCMTSAQVDAQQREQDAGRQGAGVEVRLENHEGQVRFNSGDLVWVDIVFAGQETGYVINTDPNTYRPVPDSVYVTPEDGWFRSHTALFGQSQDGSMLTELGKDPVHVPVLLNRVITFQRPGTYRVSVVTDRLRDANAWMKATTEACERCRRTNEVSIEIVERGEQEERALVRSLTKQLEAANHAPALLDEDDKRRIEVLMLQADKQAAASSTGEADDKQAQSARLQMQEVMKRGVERQHTWEEERRNAAWQLAFLGGNDAVRAKVALIADDDQESVGEATPIGPLLLEGLPSSRNLQLQLDLLEAAWRDPQRVPTDLLQTALREAKQLLRGESVTDEWRLWRGTVEDRRRTFAAYQAEVSEIVATLPQRTEANRAATLRFLTTRAKGVE